MTTNPHRFVATMTAPLEDATGKSHIEQLRQSAQEEVEFFEAQPALQPMVELGLATSNAVLCTSIVVVKPQM